MLSNFVIMLILTILLCSGTNGAAQMTTAQLEKKINTQISKMNKDFDLEVVHLETKYQELKNQISKTSAICIKDAKFLDSKINDHQDEIDNLRALLKKEDQKIDQIDQEVPIGYVYLELPSTNPAPKLWPHFKWSDVTHGYAGLFFRAEGGGSARFGDIQQANQSWISNIHSVSYHYDSWQGPHATGTYTFPLKPGAWSRNINPTHGLVRNLELYTTTDVESRPRNTAVRIWQRIG